MPTPQSSSPSSGNTSGGSVRPAKRPCDDAATHPGKRSKQEKSHFLVAIGKLLGRTVDLYEPLKPAMVEGIDHDPTMYDEATAEPEEKKRLFLWNALVKAAPELEERLANGHHQDYISFEDAEKYLDKGRSDARTQDTSTLRPIAPQILRILHHDEVADLNDKKLHHGYHHPTTAGYLTPSSLDPKSKEIREALRDGKCPELDAAVWQLLCWRQGAFNKDKIAVGLGLNEFVIRCGIAVWISPKTALADDTSKGRANNKGNAKSCGMTEMTLPALAYIHMLARFALSSEESFSAAGTEGFDYCAFYYNFLDQLSQPAMRPLVKKILHQWNLRLFPSETRNRMSSQTGATGTAALLAAQIGAGTDDADLVV